MEEIDLADQLGITPEDASFLQQVLNDVDVSSDIDINIDVSGPTESSAEPIVINDSVLNIANSNEILQGISREDTDSTSRFSSAIWYEEIRKQSIILAGLGGIGSFVAFLLSRMHPATMFVYDNDVVETANLSGQLFGIGDVGISKTYAIKKCVRNYSNYGDIFLVNSRFTNTSQPGDIMICGFDNMEARKTFFNSWRSHVELYNNPEDKSKCLFIDGRLAAESFQVFCIQGDDVYAMDKYAEQWLFNDDEAEETVCSYKQTTFCANMIASVMVNCFVNFIANQCDPLIPRDVPFFTEYDASMMFFKTE